MQQVCQAHWPGAGTAPGPGCLACMEARTPPAHLQPDHCRALLQRQVHGGCHCQGSSRRESPMGWACSGQGCSRQSKSGLDLSLAKSPGRAGDLLPTDTESAAPAPAPSSAASPPPDDPRSWTTRSTHHSPPGRSLISTALSEEPARGDHVSTTVIRCRAPAGDPPSQARCHGPWPACARSGIEKRRPARRGGHRHPRHQRSAPRVGRPLQLASRLHLSSITAAWAQTRTAEAHRLAVDVVCRCCGPERRGLKANHGAVGALRSRLRTVARGVAPDEGGCWGPKTWRAGKGSRDPSVVRRLGCGGEAPWAKQGSAA